MNKRYAAYLFGLLLSGFMSFIVSGIATWRVTGVTDAFPTTWISSWLSSWLVAFPTVLVVAPVVRRIVDRLCRTG